MKKLTALCLALMMICGLVNVCAAETAHRHSWGAWQITQQVTCVAKGIKVRTCTYCGEKQTAYTAPRGHHFRDPVEDLPTGIVYRPCEDCEAARLDVDAFKATIHERKPFLPKMPAQGQVTLEVSIQGAIPADGYATGDTVTFQYKLVNATAQSLTDVKLLCTEFSMSGPDEEMIVLTVASLAPAATAQGTFTMTISDSHESQAYDTVYEQYELGTHFTYKQRLFTACASYNAAEAVSAPDLVVNVKDDPTDLRLTIAPAADTTGFSLYKPLSFDYTLTNVSKHTISDIRLYLTKCEGAMTYIGCEVVPEATTLKAGQTVSGTATVTFYVPQAMEESAEYDWAPVIEAYGVDPRQWSAIYDSHTELIPFSGSVSTILGYACYTTSYKQQGISNLNYILLPGLVDVDFQVALESPREVYQEGDEITFHYTVTSRTGVVPTMNVAVSGSQMSLYGIEEGELVDQEICPTDCFEYYGQTVTGSWTTRIGQSNEDYCMTADHFTEAYGQYLADGVAAPAENQRAFVFALTGEVGGSYIRQKVTIVVNVAP